MIGSRSLSHAQIITREMIADSVLATLPKKFLAPEDDRKRDFRFDQILSLRLSRKDLHEVINLHFMMNLQSLRIDNNYLESLQGLQSLSRLECLDLSFNRIKDLFVEVGWFESLENLNLSSNVISSISFVATPGSTHTFMPALVTLSLGKNSFTDASALLPLKSLRALTYLDIEDNPCFSAQQAVIQFMRTHFPETKALNTI